MQRKQQLAAAEVVAACDRGARVHRDLQALMVVFFVFYFIGLTDLLTMSCSWTLSCTKKCILCGE
jgi:hypothetical protein